MMENESARFLEIQRAGSLVDLGRYQEALDVLEGAAATEDDGWWAMRALALLNLGRTREAIQAAERGLAVDAGSVLALGILSMARLENRDLRLAEEAVLAALRIDSAEPWLLCQYARVTLAAGQVGKAEQLVERAQAVDPESTDAASLAAELAYVRGSDGEAEKRYRALLSIDPEHSRGHYMLGALLHNRGRVSDAAPHFADSVRLDPAALAQADGARVNLVENHWLLKPLFPVRRFGPAGVWLAAMAVIFSTYLLGFQSASLVLIYCYLAYCVYTWLAPPLVRRYLRWRGRGWR